MTKFLFLKKFQNFIKKIKFSVLKSVQTAAINSKKISIPFMLIYLHSAQSLVAAHWLFLLFFAAIFQAQLASWPNKAQTGPFYLWIESGR
jgi:hypothetical protein